MNCRGLHCPGCHRSGPGGGIAAVLILLVLSAGARVAARILPILLHVLIVTAITAAAAAVILTALVLAVRLPARPDRRPVAQPLRRASAHAIRAAANERRELPAPPGARSLPPRAALPDAPPLPAPHPASDRTPPP